MIHIKNTFQGETITVEVDGILDQGAIPLLQNVCDRHLREGREVLVNLEGVVHITREGRDFLHKIRKRVIIQNLPEFAKLEPTA